MAKSEYAIQWTGLSKACQGALASLVDSKSDISQCSRVGKLFNEVVSKSAVVSPKWRVNQLCMCYRVSHK